MVTVTALVVLGLAGLVGLKFDLRRRLDRATASSDPDRERAEALRQISRDIEKGRSAGRGLY
jgi:hypothetical protein